MNFASASAAVAGMCLCVCVCFEWLVLRTIIWQELLLCVAWIRQHNKHCFADKRCSLLSLCVYFSPLFLSLVLFSSIYRLNQCDNENDANIL